MRRPVGGLPAWGERADVFKPHGLVVGKAFSVCGRLDPSERCSDDVHHVERSKARDLSNQMDLLSSVRAPGGQPMPYLSAIVSARADVANRLIPSRLLATPVIRQLAVPS